MNSQTTFTEIQRFTQWWLWLFLLGIWFFSFYIFYKQLFLGSAVGTKPMSNLGLIIYVTTVTLFLGLFLVMHLKTEIDKDEIRFAFFPFIKKSIPWEDVESVDTIKYGFVGGWGIRLGTKYGTVYNIKGNKGLELKLKSGKKYLIGTQKKDELNQVLAHIVKDLLDS